MRVVLIALASLALGACGKDESTGMDASLPPLQFDASVPDAGQPRPDAGGIDRLGACSEYCAKLFICGYYPREDHPTNFSPAVCTQLCAGLGGGAFPNVTTLECVRNSECSCDGAAGCQTPDACFPGL